MRKLFKKILKIKSGKRFRKTHRYFRRHYARSFWTRLLVSMLGFIILCLGIVMLIFPGPGLLFILLGLVFLSFLLPAIVNYLDKLESYVKFYYDCWKMKKK